ncbi:ABC transporter permease [Bradyrhizobium sp. LTSP857]|uniref:ABC transporter permease n=1 Tax=Bradyrhizobium sp. LTSP857 TaxID=1619231 RepID=UPI0005D1797C|nr:ABC transporter permease [Bradyrhizobium sp. LTSP857]KJC52497.1 ABC transporter permease [Bradyrhizobium sp. LTSP857]
MKRFALDPRTLINRDDNIGRLVLMIVLIIVVMTWLSPNKFLNLYNFESLSFLFPELGILAIAMLVAMLTGGIDLSVIGIANLSAIMAGLFFHAAIGVDGIRAGEGCLMTPVGIALALATGMIAGAVNGLLVTRLRITPILATLGTGQIFTGLALVLTGGPAIVGFPAAWNMIGNGKLLGLAAPLIVFLVIATAIAFLIDRTSFGVSLQLIGTNPKAALFAGINRTRLIFWSFVLSGGLAALAGVLLSARTNAAKSDYGTSYLLQSILIAVLGGTNPSGGRGTVTGVALAVIALMLLSSGLQILRFSNHLIDFVWGAFLVLVVTANAWKGRVR